MLVVGQPPLRIAENQRILVVFANLDSSDNLKGKVASNLQDNMEGAMPKGVMEMVEKQHFNVLDNSIFSDKTKGQLVDIEMTQDVDNYIHVVFQFTVRKDPLTIQNSEKVV